MGGGNDGSAGGVQVAGVVQDTTTPLKRIYDPGHPDADAQGYVSMPNVDTVTEMVDLISASQALATGQASDPTAVVMAVERAQLAMQLASQIRTKAVEAAQDIFHTQV